MDAVFEFMSGVGGDGSTMMVSAFVFLSAAAFAFGVMAVLQVRLAVKRRAAEIGTTGATAQADDPRSLRYASKIATQRLIDYTAKHYSGENAGDVKELRRRRQEHERAHHQGGVVASRYAADELENGVHVRSGSCTSCT